MSSELCRRAAQAFINALLCYLRSNAMRTLKIASLTGQNKVRVSLRAFMRCHDTSSGFDKIEEVVNTLTKCSESSWIHKLGWDYVFEGNELYFIIPLDGFKKLTEVREKELMSTLLRVLGF